MIRICSVFLLALFCSLSVAAPTAAPVRAEIDALLASLQSSGCQFNRNGSWYSAEQAKQHLLGKLDYIERKTTVRSAEQFIELAASKSSYSGKPYQVKCGHAATVESKQWLTSQLAYLRAQANKVMPSK